MKSSNWTCDELLAVLALYCRLPFGKLHRGNSEVIACAQRLGRTPSAVAMKLVNFASFDPELQRRGIKGLKNARRGDRALWEEFEADPERVAFESQRVFESLESKDRTVHQSVESDHFKNRNQRISSHRQRKNCESSTGSGLFPQCGAIQLWLKVHDLPIAFAETSDRQPYRALECGCPPPGRPAQRARPLRHP